MNVSEKPRKVALITGATSGLGKCLALKLLREGYSVIGHGRSETRLADLVLSTPEALRTYLTPLLLDLNEPARIPKLISALPTAIDLLVNCAGISFTGRIEDLPIGEFERAWRVNFLSPVALIQSVLPGMRAKGLGMIVNVSSGVARRALPYSAPYCSAKAALNSFTDSLRVELAETAIQVTLFSPGPVATRFHENIIHYGNTKLNSPPLNGKTPERIAEKLYQVILKKRSRKVVGFKASVAHHLNYWSPRLTDKIVGNMFRLECRLPNGDSEPTQQMPTNR